MADAPLKLACSICHFATESAEEFATHMLTTNHVAAGIDKEALKDGAGFAGIVKMLAFLQSDPRGKPLPEGTEMRPLSREDIMIDDDLSEDEKQQILDQLDAIDAHERETKK